MVFDGIYGESDTWLTEQEIASAESDLEALDAIRPSASDSVPELNLRRRERTEVG